jgi:micrococcal nuclease
LKHFNHKYIYDVEVVSIYDGDTVRVNIDLGFGHVWKGTDGKGVKLRLYGINTPEVRGKERPEGLKSKQALVDLLKGNEVILKTHKDSTGKYGRYLATLYVNILNENNEASDTINVNEWLVENGYAEYRNY